MAGTTTTRTYLTLKALIAVIFCLIGLQYLSLLQVSEKQRRPGNSRNLFYFERGGDSDSKNGHHRSGGILESISHLLEPSKNLGSLELEFSTTTIPAQNRISSNISPNSTGKLCTKSSEISSLKKSTSSSGNTNKTNDIIVDQECLCPMIPPGLHGAVKVETEHIPSMEKIEKIYKNKLELGGRYKPNKCVARHRVAIIVPYRDREEHLRTFLFHMHSYLPRQQLDYGIFVVEQHGSEPFNRAMLMNVGAAEALKSYDYLCFIFHDVDLLPEDDRNLYSCPVQPRHMSVAINNFLYRLPYDDIFGGVSAMTVDQFRQVNGFSNKFWGWGGEDDDISNRLRQKKLYISRYPANIARYRMLKHSKDKANPDRFKYLYSGAKRMDKDGYNSLKYKPVSIELKRLYTWILVDLPHV